MSGRESDCDSLRRVEGHIRENLFPDPTHIGELLELFFLTVGERLAQAETALGDANWRELERLAHVIRGAAAHVGAEKLSQVAALLELAAEKHEAGGARDCLPELNRLFKGLRDEAEATDRP